MRRLSIFFLLFFLTFQAGLWAQEDDPDSLAYQVSVNVKLLPLFAQDKDGNPVFDLSMEDIELYVNGKPSDISFFKRYDFESSTIESKREAPDQEERIIFVILDTMFNSRSGFRRSKEITRDLVEQAKPTDKFIIFENSLLKGIRHLCGPDENKLEMLREIHDLKRPISHWATQMYASRQISDNIGFSLATEARLETDQWRSLRENVLQSDRMHYKHQVEQFGRMLAQFKYILKTISKPKLVFLISEGMSAGVFQENTKMESPDGDTAYGSDDSANTNNTDLASILGNTVSNFSLDNAQLSEEHRIFNTAIFNHLKKVVKSINYGGSVIHTINPRTLNDTQDDKVSGEMSLRFLARASGGQYFSGADPGSIVKRIKKSTSAYYEFAFYTTPEEGKELEIKIKCLRPDVRVYSTNYTEGSILYRDMDDTQKKMFALNVVHGGTWSRNLGKIMPARFKRLTLKTKKKKLALNVLLPMEMRDHELDVFLINMDPDTKEVDMEIVSKKAKKWIELKINRSNDKNQYFVIIEPANTYCIYNQA